MKLKKISEDHYIVMDDSEIKESDYVYWEGKIVRAIDTSYWSAKKITHSTQPLEWFGGKIIFLSEVKELLGVMDVEKKAQIEWGNVHRTGVLGYIDGYNQALEDNKEKKYTYYDIENAFNSGRGYGVPDDIKDFDSFIQSLQPAEWEVEFADGKLQLVKE